MKMRLFTLCWGEPYCSWFEDALAASLLWPSNNASVREHSQEWNIYTRDQDRDRLRATAERIGVPIQFHPFAVNNSSGETLQPALFDHMRNCLQDASAAFIAPPDTIFGEGSVAAICEVGRSPGICVAVPHVRVNAGALPAIAGRPMPNAELVDFAFKNLHKTWADADAALPNTNSFLGGVSWRQLRKGVYAVTHRLPTCYLANIDASDVDWFSRQWETGTWDHTWPAKIVKEQRQRLIASSDAAFIVELTRENENIPPVAVTDPAAPDKFWRDLEHNYVNRNTVAIFRGVSAGA
jgi:hypothetical protein